MASPRKPTRIQREKRALIMEVGIQNSGLAIVIILNFLAGFGGAAEELISNIRNVTPMPRLAVLARWNVDSDHA